MIGSPVVQACSEPPGVGSVGIHTPDFGHSARLRPAENDGAPVGRLAGPQVPNGGAAPGQGPDCAAGGVDPADLRAAPGRFRLVVTVEVVRVRTLRLVFPGNLAAWELSRKENGAVSSPREHIGPSAAVSRTAVAGAEPVVLSPGQDPLLRSVGAADADIGPVVARILPEVAVQVGEPCSIGRPYGSEVEMFRMGRNEDAAASFEIAGPDLVARRAGQVKGDPPPLPVEAEAIGEAFSRSRELTGIAAIQVHAEDLSDLVAEDLDQHAFVVQQQLGSVEDRHPIPGGDFGETFFLEVIGPDMRGRPGVVPGEGAARAVPSRFHAQEQDSPAVAEEPGRLPCHLVRLLEIENLQTAAGSVHDGRPARRREDDTHRRAGRGSRRRCGGATGSRGQSGRGGERNQEIAAGMADFHGPFLLRTRVRESPHGDVNSRVCKVVAVKERSIRSSSLASLAAASLLLVGCAAGPSDRETGPEPLADLDFHRLQVEPLVHSSYPIYRRYHDGLAPQVVVITARGLERIGWEDRPEKASWLLRLPEQIYVNGRKLHYQVGMQWVNAGDRWTYSGAPVRDLNGFWKLDPKYDFYHYRLDEAAATKAVLGRQAASIYPDTTGAHYSVSITNGSGEPWEDVHTWICLDHYHTPVTGYRPYLKVGSSWTDYQKLPGVGPSTFLPVEGRKDEFFRVLPRSKAPSSVSFPGVLCWNITDKGHLLTAHFSQDALAVLANQNAPCTDLLLWFGDLQPGERVTRGGHVLIVRASLDEFRRQEGSLMRLVDRNGKEDAPGT